MRIKEIFKLMIEKGASDLFLRVGVPFSMRIDGRVLNVGEKKLTYEDVNRAIDEITTHKQKACFKENLDTDFAIYLSDIGYRFRVSVFFQRNSPSLVVRLVRSDIWTFEELNLPAQSLEQLSLENFGLILVTGAAGSGKSTTLASMIDYINGNCPKHILTVEEPIEFTFEDKKSVINQRELGLDVHSYEVALKQFALQSPDVIFIGTIRDYTTMKSALTAASTGVLVLSTLHTVNAAQTVERIINFFPPHQHAEVRTQLALLLKGVISLRLVPLKGRPGRIPAYEVMLLTPTISRLIREGKIWEIPHFISEGEIFGMQTFSQSLVKLVEAGKISVEDAANFADNRDEFGLALKGVKKK